MGCTFLWCIPWFFVRVIYRLVRPMYLRLYCSVVFNLTSFVVYSFCSLSSSFFHRVKEPKRPAHGLSKSLPFFARATLCEHSVERRLPLVSAVPISGTKELASRTPIIVWHTRSDTFVLVPQLELTRAVAQTVPVLFWHYYYPRYSASRSNSLKWRHC